MTRTAPVSDLFTRPYADLDDVQARITAAVAFATERTAGRTLPADLADALIYARATLADLAAITRKAARAKAFKLEHGIETMKDLWFAFTDHAGQPASRRTLKLPGWTSRLAQTPAASRSAGERVPRPVDRGIVPPTGKRDASGCIHIPGAHPGPS